MSFGDSLYDRITQDLIGASKAFVSITGGGGKTTTMIGLAKYLKSCGRSVLITTTTKVASPYVLDYGQDLIFNNEDVLKYQPKHAEVVFYAQLSEIENKWRSPSFENLTQLYARYDVIISEADGSRGLPIKIHTAKDPQIHPLTTATISLMGVWAIGKSTTEVAFGPSAEIPKTVNEEYLGWYISDTEGLLKGTVKNNRAILFNGCDKGYDSKLLRTLEVPKDVKCYAASANKGVLYEAF